MEIDSDEWDRVMAVNVKGLFHCVKAVYPAMKQQGKGKIINISSGTTLNGSPFFLHYVSSKAGVIGFTKSVAKELGSRNIRCNAIAPGFIETDMTSYLKEGEQADKYKAGIPLGKFGTAEDVANATLFLASDLGSYVSGQVINVDGGLYM